MEENIRDIKDANFNMSFSIGIVGLPNVGKSTIFNAITGESANCSNFPFCTIDPNKAIVPVPDDTLEAISKYVKTGKVTPTTLEVIDIAGLIEGSHKGEGLGNQFLSFIQKVDAIAHIVRLFDDPHISHIGALNPERDLDVVETELKLKDLEILRKRMKSIEKKAHSGDKEAREEFNILNLLEKKISNNDWVKVNTLSEEEKSAARRIGLISVKPEMVIANVDETMLKKSSDKLNELKKYSSSKKMEVIPVSAKIEEELRELQNEERNQFLLEYGIEKGSLERLILEGYKLLNLITFYTFNENELRAWTLQKGDSVLDAASKVHTDMAKGFIKAAVIPAEIFLEHKSIKDVKEKGFLRIEGKDCIVNDRDIIYIHFK
ncbi:MAG: redox-regulated ATPase YchF [Candidatus Cloacimonadota bacterium]|nr:MAG: redox-regulated ATPase YchF [Candidatus Cloacimonadota bacterium]